MPELKACGVTQGTDLSVLYEATKGSVQNIIPSLAQQHPQANGKTFHDLLPKGLLSSALATVRVL